MFTTVAYPQVVSFSTGAPFQPFARFPQIRYTYRPGRISVVAAITQQRDAFQEIGGRKLQQQSGWPAGHLHVRYAGPSFLVGVGATLKSVRPELTGNRFTSGAVLGYGSLTTPIGVVRAKLTYGHDLADHLMTGGFVSLEEETYRCLGVLGAWLDFGTSSAPWSAGIFGGYLKNLGSGKEMSEVVSMNARAPNIRTLWRIAPRVAYEVGSVRFAVEFEATSALYCSGYSDSLEPMEMPHDDAVVNVRTLLAAYYTF
jgi:hypothetical protein